jgi:hypothetical protein
MRESSGLWPDGIEAPVFVSKGLYKLKEHVVGKIWAVFAGQARVTDRFDVIQHETLCTCTYANSQVF